MQENITNYVLRALQQCPRSVLVLLLVIAPATHMGRAEAPEQQQSLPATSLVEITPELTPAEQAAKIDAYFGQWNLPLAGHGADFVAAAEKYNIPWNMLAAISFVETTGGKFACKNPNAAFNAYGWGSCRNGFGFKSWADGIDKISAHLGGHVETTDDYYKDMTVREQLEAYNPPSVVPGYADKVMRIMHKIEVMGVTQQ